MPLDRELISQALVVLALCIGAWMLFVEPKASVFRGLDDEIAQGRARLAAADYDRIGMIAKRAAEFRTLAAEVTERNRLARDSAGLYGAIMALAQQQELEVRNLQPRVQEPRSDSAIGLTRIDIRVDGSYAQVARFVTSLATVNAYLRVSTLSVAPTEKDGVGLTSMKVGCEVLAFELPAVLERIAKGTP